MTTSNGRLGPVFERRVRDELESYGYVVGRSAASRGPWDLLALRRKLAASLLIEPEGNLLTPGVLVVQVKANGKLGPAEWNALYAIARSSGTLPLLASFNRTVRPYRIRYRLLTGIKTDGRTYTPALDVTFRPMAMEEVASE